MFGLLRLLVLIQNNPIFYEQIDFYKKLLKVAIKKGFGLIQFS